MLINWSLDVLGAVVLSAVLAGLERIRFVFSSVLTTFLLARY